MKTKNRTTLHLRKSIGPAAARRGYLLVAAALACFGLSPKTQAVSPAPDGGYAGENTAEGTNALFMLTTGTNNTAIGSGALHNNTRGSTNTAIGSGALYFNVGTLTSGAQNTASGFQALHKNTTGFSNTANGFQALYSNTIGRLNTAYGIVALYHNTDGNNNTAVGYQALLSNTSGLSNIALGDFAGENIVTGSNNIDIGTSGPTDESNKIRIGTVGTQTATFIAGIHGATTSGGTAVFVNSSGQLGTMTSSARFKDEIKPIDTASEVILALKPVTFRYKKEIDPERTPQFGLVAEDVEQVNHDLVVRDKQGKPYSVRYDQVNVMLLNEFLKEHHKVEQQRKDFEAAIARQQKQIEALTAGLQRVSAQLELSKPAPQVAENK
jgi:hypothetical protein